MEKKVIMFLSILMIVFACNSDDDNNPSADPGSAFIYYDLLKNNGTPFEEGEIFHKIGLLNGEGNWVFSGVWGILPKTENIAGDTYFGSTQFQMGWESGDEPEAGSEWVNKKIIVLKYLDTQIIDTLMVRDSTRYPEFRYYDIFLNGEILQSYTQEDDGNLEWLITITKDEF